MRFTYPSLIRLLEGSILKTMRRFHFGIFQIVLLWNTASSSIGSVPIAMGMGHVDASTTFRADIVLHGVDSFGSQYVFACRTYAGPTPLQAFGVAPGGSISPQLLTTSGDFGGFSLAADGTTVPIRDDSSALGDNSFIDIHGPLVSVPTGPLVRQSLFAPVTFDTLFNLFNVGQSFLAGDPPAYVMWASGTGVVDIVIDPIPGFAEYQVVRASFQLYVPEPTSISAGCMIVGVLVLQSRRRHRTP